ncbi:GNAT family N-acetyltransferase [Synechococcus sp. ATX 2A4]|uniref:GNAT family N-acetyltransferase n=1 Tax=Synechococcus sp. ATX 2A4 TaxID=2823727 RepID=UPI0020CBA6A0|nr:GNAT family N-acetyltransferase [Synechococcus sp. ATX 2A4]MCP9884736.1 GNAT family N-acetyltransferase [Synechococcus sp. ATX 2A4]
MQPRLEIRPIRSEELHLIAHYITGLQAHLAQLDPEERIICPEGYGHAYATDLLRRVTNGDGRILLALINDQPAGIAAGIVKAPPFYEAIGTTVQREGEILELFVSEDYRGQGVATELMATLEDYFRAKGCEVAGIAVFAHNTKAHRLYTSLGYADRMIYGVKSLR